MRNAKTLVKSALYLSRNRPLRFFSSSPNARFVEELREQRISDTQRFCHYPSIYVISNDRNLEPSIDTWKAHLPKTDMDFNVMLILGIGRACPNLPEINQSASAA